MYYALCFLHSITHCTPLECCSWTNRPSIDITLRWSEKQSRFLVFWFSRLESCESSILSVACRLRFTSRRKTVDFGKSTYKILRPCVKFCFDSCRLAYIRGWLFPYHVPTCRPSGALGYLRIAPGYKHAAPLGLKALMHQNSRHGLHRRGGVPPPDGLGDPTPTYPTSSLLASPPRFPVSRARLRHTERAYYFKKRETNPPSPAFYSPSIIAGDLPTKPVFSTRPQKSGDPCEFFSQKTLDR